jgi:hypothetical protein
VAAAGVAAAWWLASSAGAGTPAPASTLAAIPPPAPSSAVAAPGARRGAPLSAAGLADHKARLAQWRQRLDRAQQTLASYKLATRYPYESRPAGEHADQWVAHPTIEDDMPLRMPGGSAAPGVHIHKTQQAVFVSGNASALLTVAAVDDNGNPLPLRILSSVARAPQDAPGAARAAPQPVQQSFVDDGTQGDAQAGDGTFSTRLQPASEGFADWSGLIRTELTVLSGTTQGYVAFDVIYTPETPATWAGPVHEALEDGSLALYLPVDVALPGRYVITGRVDDATGRPFALLSFNDQLSTGTRQVRLSVFGRLVRDQKPQFPLTLHDVDGFLLKPDAFPDRALMPERPGPVYTTRKYSASVFSDATWSSEETARYIGEFSNDVATAQQQVDQLQQQAGP